MIRLPVVDAEVLTLPNGLTIIVQEDFSAPVASVQAWVQTGSIHEDRWTGGGLSHLLEHMLFKGTERRGASGFAQAVQDEGGYINAYTSFERTVYWIDIPAPGVPIALELLADALQHSLLPADELVKEQEVIRREFAMGFDDPDRVASQALFATAFCEHPYRHPVIGYLDVFDALTRDDLLAYYRARYVPNNTFYVIVGAVSTAEVRDQLSAHYAGSPRQALAPIFIPPEPGQLGRREAHREFPTELTRQHLVWHVPPVTHADVPALDITAAILGGGRSSRLYRRLREERALVHHIDAWCWAPAEGGLFGMDAVLDAGHRAEVRDETQRILGDVCAAGVTEAELQKARKNALSHQLAQLTTMRGKANDLGTNWLLTRNLEFSRDYLAALQQVTGDDVQRVLKRYCTDGGATCCTLNPEGTLAKRPGPARAPRSAAIIKSELPNGLRLLVREDGRLPLVSIVATFKAGLLAETVGINGITRLLARTLLKGTANRSAEQIADEIESVGGSIGSEGGNNSITISLRVMEPDLPLALNLLGEILRTASLPDKAIGREKEVQLAAIKEEEEEMTSSARNLMRQHLFGTHPYALRHLGTPQSVARIARDDLTAFRDRHLVAKNGVVSVFGAVRGEEVHALVEQELGALPPGTATLVAPDQAPPLDGPVEVIEMKQKQQAVLMIGVPGADVFSPDRAALELLDEACSDLGSRLFLRIREQMGLAYFVGSSDLVGLARGAFAFYAGTDPAKLDAVKAALHEEIDKLASDGLTAAELARAKAKLLGQQDIKLQSNDTFAYATALDELYGLGFDHYLKERSETQAVTLAHVADVARRYFAEQPRITAIVRPPAAPRET